MCRVGSSRKKNVSKPTQSLLPSVSATAWMATGATLISYNSPNFLVPIFPFQTVFEIVCCFLNDLPQPHWTAHRNLQHLIFKTSLSLYILSNHILLCALVNTIPHLYVAHWEKSCLVIRQELCCLPYLLGTIPSASSTWHLPLPKSLISKGWDLSHLPKSLPWAFRTSIFVATILLCWYIPLFGDFTHLLKDSVSPKTLSGRIRPPPNTHIFLPFALRTAWLHLLWEK